MRGSHFMYGPYNTVLFTGPRNLEIGIAISHSESKYRMKIVYKVSLRISSIRIWVNQSITLYLSNMSHKKTTLYIVLKSSKIGFRHWHFHPISIIQYVKLAPDLLENSDKRTAWKPLHSSQSIIGYACYVMPISRKTSFPSVLCYNRYCTPLKIESLFQRYLIFLSISCIIG